MGLFAFVLLLGNLIKDLLGYILAGQMSTATVVRLVLLLIPFVVSYALPMGMLTGILLTLGRLSADSEITAMRAAGLSLFRIARPALLLGVLGALAGLYTNFESMPWARVTYDRELTEAVRANPVSILVPKTFIRNFPGYVIYVGDRQGEVLKDFTLWQLDKQSRVVRMLRAGSSRIQYDPAANTLILTLLNGQAENLNQKAPEDFSEAPQVANFERWDPIPLPLDQLFGRPTIRQKLQWMTFEELQAQEAKVAAQPAGPGGAKEHERDVMKVKLVIQDKFTMSLAVLSFALVGVPLGIRVSRKETSANLGVAVALFLGYYFLTMMVGWLDRHPEYRPDLLYWAPNLAFLGIAIWLFRRAERS